MMNVRKKSIPDITLGLDLGSTNIKAVAVDGTGKLRGFLKAETDTAGPDAVGEAVRRLVGEFNIEWKHLQGISLTGIGTRWSGQELDGVPVRRVEEFTAMGKGALAMSGRQQALVASMGTGTAFVLAGAEGAVHLGGTGVGGGAVSGLCRYLYDLQRFPDIMALAEKGDLHKIDFKVGDLPGNNYIDLSPDLTLANFGKIDVKASREDVILGLINMVLETIGTMAVLACKSGGMDTVVLCGALTILPQVKEVFGRFTKHTGITFIVPENSTYVIAYGAAMKQQHGEAEPLASKPGRAPRRLSTAAREMVREFESRRDPLQAAQLMRFFKTDPGQYGEGDQFLGIKVPVTRQIAKSYQKRLSFADYDRLLDSKWHEIRLAALLMMGSDAERLAKADDTEELEELFQLYDRRLEQANNWDLIDLSVYRIMGAYWQAQRTPPRRVREQLSVWAESGHLWRERAAVIATMARLRAGSLKETFWLSERFIDHPHDLMHKATGWMLREAGKRDVEALRRFLKRFHRRLPRTALRYAIEHMDANERSKWMGK